MKQLNYFLNKHYPWIFPLLLLLLITPATPAIDMEIESYFYRLGEGNFLKTPFYQFFYDHGPSLGLWTASGSLVLFLASFFVDSIKRWRSSLLLLVLTMVVGSGLIVHLVFKDHWGRPRPRQIEEFGGTQIYRPYWKPNFFSKPEPSKSFLCGHCSTGFYFFALALAARKLNNKLWSYGAWAFAFIWGGLLSLSRMAQGGHFFTDVIITGLVMWLTAYWLQQLLEGYEKRINRTAK